MAGESGPSVARALSALPAGRWRAMHDVRWPGRRLANIEYVVVGPPGVFVIASLDWPYRAPLSAQGELMREAAIARVADSAIAIGELLSLDPGLVRPVLCVAGDQPVSGQVRDVVVCSTGSLAQVLESGERVLAPAHVDEVFARLQRGMPSASSWSGSTGPSTVTAIDVLATRPQARTREARPQQVKPLPWQPGSEVSPAMRSALIAFAVCLLLCPLISYFVWPLVNGLIAMLA